MRPRRRPPKSPGSGVSSDAASKRSGVLPPRGDPAREPPSLFLLFLLDRPPFPTRPRPAEGVARQRCPAARCIAARSKVVGLLPRRGDRSEGLGGAGFVLPPLVRSPAPFPRGRGVPRASLAQVAGQRLMHRRPIEESRPRSPAWRTRAGAFFPLPPLLARSSAPFPTRPRPAEGVARRGRRQRDASPPARKSWACLPRRGERSEGLGEAVFLLPPLFDRLPRCRAAEACRGRRPPKSPGSGRCKGRRVETVNATTAEAKRRGCPGLASVVDRG